MLADPFILRGMVFWGPDGKEIGKLGDPDYWNIKA